MKIKVHEIEGELYEDSYYCTVDDIAVAKSIASRSPITKDQCLIDIIQSYRVYFNHKIKIFFYSDGAVYSPVPSGFYLIYDYDIGAKDNYFSKRQFSASEVRVLALEGDRCIFDVRPDDREPIPIDPSFCSIELSDAQIYLSPYENIDFVLPSTSQAEPVTEAAPETEASPYLNENNENHPPYLAIAIEMWERRFINNEIIRISTTSGKASNSHKEQITNLLDMHYPSLAANAKKIIAEIATAKSSESKNNFK